MKHVCTLFTAIFLLFGMPSASTSVEVAGVATALTLNTAINGVRSIIKELERSASSLIEQGNMALAQQQMLLAGILQSTIDQVNVAYKDALSQTAEQIGVFEKNTTGDLQKLIADLGGVFAKSATEVKSVVYTTQGAANQLLNRLPLVKHIPVFYGVVAGDIQSGDAPRPADIEILGFMFSDPRLNNKKPVVRVADNAIEGTSVSIQEDRVQVQIPDDIKSKIGFGAGPCSPRGTFPVTIDVFLAVEKGWWLFTRTEERTVPFNANVLAGTERYDVAVSEDGILTTVADRTERYAQESGEVSVGCEDSTPASVRWEAPSGARQINCVTRWVNLENTNGEPHSCAITGTVVTATGSIRGRNREFFNCRGGGHGRLRVEGTYVLQETRSMPYSNVPVGPYVMGSGILNVALGKETAKTRKRLFLSIKRKGCNQELDRIEINLPENELAGVEQSSKKGHFTANYRDGQLAVRHL